jgi:PTH1 family peptidyl-tRNA hydrolase
MDPAAYVLQRFSPDESDALQEVLERAANAALAFVVDGLELAMSRFNGGPDRT